MDGLSSASPSSRCDDDGESREGLPPGRLVMGEACSPPPVTRTPLPNELDEKEVAENGVKGVWPSGGEKALPLCCSPEDVVPPVFRLRLRLHLGTPSLLCVAALLWVSDGVRWLLAALPLLPRELEVTDRVMRWSLSVWGSGWECVQV